VPVSPEGVTSEVEVGVEVPTSRFCTLIRGSMNFVLYSEKTWVYSAVLFFCWVVEKVRTSDNFESVTLGVLGNGRNLDGV